MSGLFVFTSVLLLWKDDQCWLKASTHTVERGVKRSSMRDRDLIEAAGIIRVETLGEC